jgi:hypothetical protein
MPSSPLPRRPFSASSPGFSRRDMLGFLSLVPPVVWLSGCSSAGGASGENGAETPDGGVTNYVRIYVDGDQRIIESNDIPDHTTGSFPNSACPFSIGPINYHFSVPANPTQAATTTPLLGWLFGVALNGVVFDPTGPYWDGDTTDDWEFEVMDATARPHLGLDQNNAHVSGLTLGGAGEYHYHGLPTGLLDRLGATGRVVLVGYAADGFPIYGPYGYSVAGDATSNVRELGSSYRLRSGERPSGSPGGRYDGTFVEDFEYVPDLGDLDECNGRVGVTPEYPEGTYHYVLTSDFPYVPRKWRGTPAATFKHPAPGPAALPPALRGYRGT